MASSSSFTSRSSRLKSLTFTGCWTCRKRKVKCDERETNGCSVCEGAGLACAGYAVRLCWVQPGQKSSQLPNASQPGPRRRGIKLHRHTGPVMSDDDIVRALATLDATAKPKSTETIGPFAIFRVDGVQDRSDGTEDAQGEADPAYAGPVSDDVPAPGRQNDSITSITSLTSISNITNLTNLTNLTNITDLTDLTGLTDLTDLTDLTNLTDLDAASPALDIDTDPDTHRIDERFDELVDDLIDTSSPHLGLSMPLFRDSQTAQLLYHFTNHVAELLQPVQHPGNPWRTTYFSFALEGCPDLWLAQTTASPSSHASLSLFHSLLSAAAFHLRNATDGSVDYHRLALQHRIKALQALNAATPQPTNQQLYLIHLTAMLSLVTVDTMAGEDSDFPVHLKACYQLKKPALLPDQDGAEGGGANSQIYSICRFLTLLARTTSPVIVARPWRAGSAEDDAASDDNTPAVFNVPNFRDSERSVEYMYGITPALGNMLAKTCQMAEHLAYYHQQPSGHHFGFVPPLLPPLQQACAALGDEITAWSVDDEPFGLTIQADNDAGEEHTMREIARCQARAFHGAVLLYYCRTLQTYGLHDRRVAPVAVDVHAQVQIIWAQLATAEDLKDAYYHRFDGGLKRSAPMSWPAFIAACEAAPGDRPLWVAWWERVNGYRIGNFARQWQIIQDVWALQDHAVEQGHGPISWRDALARTGKLVLPI